MAHAGTMLDCFSRAGSCCCAGLKQARSCDGCSSTWPLGNRKLVLARPCSGINRSPLCECGSVQLMFAIASSVVALVVRGAHIFLDSGGTGLGWTLGRPWADSRPTLGRLWVDFGPTLGRLWVDIGPSLGRLWAITGPTLGSLWADFGSTFG